MSRHISKLPDHVYFVLDSKWDHVYGPYSTLGAAKGKRTTEINVASYYSARNAADFTIVESPAGEWKTVEL